MAAIILLITLAVEIYFIVICFKHKSEQKKKRNITRLLSLGLFVVLLMTSVLKWGFRWYGLGLLLVIWSALAVVSLLRKSKARKEFTRGRIVRRSLGILVLVVITLAPVFIFPEITLPRTTGRYEVATANYIWIDPTREESFTKEAGDNRFVNIEFWYPSDYDVMESKCPLIIFSHGAYGIKSSNTSTYSELASNGYVVCSIDHPYHSLYTKSPNGDIITVNSGFMNEISIINDKQHSAEEKGKIIREILSIRTGDINFVLNQIGQMTAVAGADSLFSLIDVERIGLMGHSLGGAAAAEVAKNRGDISAVVNLDGDFLGEYILENGEEAYTQETYSKPILCFWSDLLYQNISKMGGFPFLKNTTDFYEVHIKGTSHMSYTDLPSASPFLNNMLLNMSGLEKAEVNQKYCTETMNELILQFFNCYIKKEGKFEAAAEY